MIQLKNVNFSYEKNQKLALKNINLDVKAGEVVVLCGRSGCGKTSIIRLINGLIPHFYEGDLEGDAYVAGCKTKERPLSEIAKFVGSVFQNPRSQFFNVDTTSELAFGCENQGMVPELIAGRVDAAKDALQLKPLMNRDIFKLSGGEKQQIACGCVYAADPDIVVLDEPSSNLDMESIIRLEDTLLKMKKQGKTIVISEHRLHYLMNVADRFIFMEDGQLMQAYTRDQFKALSLSELREKGLRCTNLDQVQRHSPDDGKQHKHDETFAITIENLVCRRKEAAILSIPSLKIPKGSVVALIGGNGVGKSSLSECLCGILKCSGQIGIYGAPKKAKERAVQSYMVMQDVNHQLFCDSVLAEVTMNLPHEEADTALELLKRMDLSEMADRHPASLSGGEKQRVAICAALCAGKQIIFYDEPTSGLDYGGLQNLCSLVRDSKADTLTSLVISHDLELIMECCTHVLQLKDGKVCAFYPLDEAGTARTKNYFIKKEGTRLNENRRPTSRPTGLRRLIQLAFTKKALMIPSVILSVLASIASFIPYLSIFSIVQEITGAYPNFDASDGEAIIKYGLLAFGGVVLNILFYYFALFLSHLAAFGTSYDLKIDFTTYLAKLPLGFHLNYGSGRLRKITENNIGKAEDFIAHQFPDLAAAMAAPAVMVILLLAVDWRYGAVSLLGIMASYIIQMSGFRGSSVQELMKKGQIVQENMNNASVEYVRGITVVKAFHQTVYSFKRLYRAIKSYTDFVIPYNLKFENSNSLYTALINNLYLFLIPVMILIGINTPADEFQTFASTAIFYLVFVPSISSVMTKVMYSASNCMQVSSCVERMDEILDIAPLPEPDAPEHCRGGDLAFRHVSFSYDEGQERKALDDVSFTAETGKITAVVGPSGGGKSTIANLIPRFYDVTEGCITIGGVDIRDIAGEELTSLVSFVFQDSFLFKQSILENIRMGRQEATREEVIAAAKAARCDDFISALPQGYDTIYGKDGVYLSGGEKQRIAIARAIVKEAPILVLDEATAFSDAENEHLIQKALLALMKNKTVIMIAHRLSTIKNADSILVMEQGRLIEEGTHESLLKQNKKYKQMWDTYTGTLNWKMEKGAENHE